MEKTSIWACPHPDHFQQDAMAFCREEKEFLCPFCLPDHEAHNPIKLPDLKTMLLADKDDMIKNVKEARGSYTEGCVSLENLNATLCNQIENQVSIITTILNQIRDGLILKKESTINEIKNIINGVREYPEKCDIYIKTIQTICDAEDIYVTDITPDELRDFCMDFTGKKYVLDNAREQLDFNKKKVEGSITDFVSLMDSYSIPLTKIKDSIILQSDDQSGINTKTEEAFSKLDTDREGKVKLDVVHEMVKSVIKSYGISKEPSKDVTSQAFAVADILGEHVLAPTQVQNVIKASWVDLREKILKESLSS
jgi:hypothetical protein